MLRIVGNDTFSPSASSALLVLVPSKKGEAVLRKEVKAVLSSLAVDTKALFAAYKFTGAAGSSVAHLGSDGTHAIPVVCVGVGNLDKSTDENMEVVRRALGGGINALRKSEKKHVSIMLPTAKEVDLTHEELIRQAAILLHIATYSFVAFKQKKEVWTPEFIFVGSGKGDKTAIAAGSAIGVAMNRTRTLADTPPNHMTPSILAGHAADICKEYKLKYTVFGQDKAAELGMGCFLSVAKGSVEEGKMVIMEYSCGDTDAPTIALVGKGVCFDTGGISLKPANYMTGMKYDMSGAAAVMGTMQVIAQSKPNVNVIGITPLVENMPDGRASKQDDVVTAMNGKTVEIENTDAEGRLILSDALTYVQKNYNPEVIIDIATLTGACAYALGPFFSGMMTRDEKLASRLSAIGSAMGDRVWRLPLTDDYKPGIESTVADITNSGSPAYKAGATTAGLFLEHFIEENRRWVHLDIAGTDSKIPGSVYLGAGATGVGVRLLVEFVCTYDKTK